MLHLPPHSLPRSKGRATPRTAIPLLIRRRHRFPGSKGRSSVPVQVASLHELSFLALSLLLLLLLLSELSFLALSLLLLLLLLPLLLPGTKRSSADPGALAALATDKTGTAVPPVDGAASDIFVGAAAIVDDAGAPDAPPHRRSGENSTAGRRRC